MPENQIVCHKCGAKSFEIYKWVPFNNSEGIGYVGQCLTCDTVVELED